MNLHEKLAVINGYNELVRADRVPPLTCYRCQAITLHYVEDDEVVLRCTGCSRRSNPGWLWYTAQQSVINFERSKDAGN